MLNSFQHLITVDFKTLKYPELSLSWRQARVQGRVTLRINEMKGMIVIDRELCKGCAYCVDACPLDVIVIEDRFNKKGFFPAHPEHMDRCTGCTICAQMCPEIAIEVYKEDKKF